MKAVCILIAVIGFCVPAMAQALTSVDTNATPKILWNVPRKGFTNYVIRFTNSVMVPLRPKDEIAPNQLPWLESRPNVDLIDLRFQPVIPAFAK